MYAAVPCLSHRIYPLLCGFVFLLISYGAQAGVFSMVQAHSELALPEHLEYQFSAPQELDPRQLLANDWQFWPKASRSLMGESRRLWLRIPVQLDDRRTWFVQSEWPQMGGIEAFLEQDGRLQALPKEPKQRYPLFRLPTGQPGLATVYVTVNAREIVMIPLRLIEQEAVQHWREQSNLWLGGFFGLGTAVILFNSLLWLATRNSTFLLYVLFQIAVYSFEASRFGLYAPFIGELDNGRAFIVTAGLAFLLANAFAVRVLEIPTQAPRLWRWFLWIFVPLCGYVALLATPWSAFLMSSAMPIASVGAVMPLILASLRIRQVRPYLAFYCLAWGLLIFGTLLLNLNIFGWMPITNLSTYAQLVGLSVEALLLSFVLGKQLHDLQVERGQIASELLALKQDEGARLHIEVADKTRALNQALDELQKANAQLSERAITDTLTGCYNRRHFDESLQRLLARAAREGQPLSLGLVDIDHFKSFNDRFGHQVGDDCLRRVAEVLRQGLQRPGDLFFRYGGEEFAVLLPGTDLSGGLHLLEALRQAVAQLDFCVQGAAVPLHISIGLACWQGPLQRALEIETQGLIEQADQCLYQAKRSGRNKVSCVPV